mgnify:FL=1
MAGIKICPNCGKINKEPDKFCSDCGSSLDKNLNVTKTDHKNNLVPEIGSDVKYIIIVFGYFLIIFGVITGLTIGERPILPFYGLILACLIGIFLYLKGGSTSKHGKIILLLALIAMVIWFITSAIFWSSPYGALYG